MPTSFSADHTEGPGGSLSGGDSGSDAILIVIYEFIQSYKVWVCM